MTDPSIESPPVGADTPGFTGRSWDEYPTVLTVAEAASLLRVSASTVIAELGAGRLPGKHIGREWRLSRDALRDYLATAGTPRRSRQRDPVAAD